MACIYNKPVITKCNVVPVITAIYTAGDISFSDNLLHIKCVACGEFKKVKEYNELSICISCSREIKLNEMLGIENTPFREPYIGEEFKKDKNSHIPSNIQNRLKRRRI